MFRLRTHAFIAAGLFALLVLIPLVGSLAAPNGVGVMAPPLKIAFQVFYLGIFAAFGLSLIPVIVMSVLGAQVKLGNADKAPVAAAVRRQNTIVWVLMGLVVLGAAIAIPAMILDGGFDESTPQKAAPAP